MSEQRILLVDDEPANVRLLTRLLGTWGYTELRSTSDSTEVPGLFRTWAPDLLLLDLMMPGLDGFQVLELIGPDNAGPVRVPVLVLTADVTAEAKRRALAEGATDFVTKPFDFDAIGVDRVREVVGGLREGRSEGWYGLGFRYLSARQLRERDLPAGLLVSTVVEGSPADRAGVPAGQLLVTAIGGRPVSNSLRGYCDAVSEIPSGAPVRVSALDIRTRARQTLTLR